MNFFPLNIIPMALYMDILPYLPSLLKTLFQEKSVVPAVFQKKSVVPAGSSPVILVLALNEMKNQLLTFPNKSITLEQLSAI